MLSPLEARQIILDRTPELSVERLPLASGLGRILARDFLATEDSPLFDRSAMDGYAIARAEEQTLTFPVVMTLKAGETPSRALKLGEAARVFTGAAVPAGATAVVPQELVDVADSTVTVRQWPKVSHIRRRGEDHVRGEFLLRKGQRLGPCELAVLASEGEDQPMVQACPRVVHVVTGDELVAPGEPVGEGQIRDSNSTLIAALIAEAGGTMVRQFHFKDQLADMVAGLRAVPEDSYDLLLVSGGASVGEHDWTKALLRELGFTLVFEQVNVRPGKPLIFAKRGTQMAFGLPGNPVSHVACFHLFVKATLQKMQGLTVKTTFATAFLEEDFVHAVEPREAYWPARVINDAGVLRLKPMRWMSSGHIVALAGVNAFLRLPQGVGNLASGDPVEYLEIA